MNERKECRAHLIAEMKNLVDRYGYDMARSVLSEVSLIVRNDWSPDGRDIRERFKELREFAVRVYQT